LLMQALNLTRLPRASKIRYFRDRLLDRPVNPPIKSGEGDDSTEAGQPYRKML